MVHAYKLSFTSSVGGALTTRGLFESAAAVPSMLRGGDEGAAISSALAVASADEIELQALPQLVYRAALGVSAAAQLLSHPAIDNVLGVVLAGDSALRFVDCSPAPDVAVSAAADCSAGSIGVDGGAEIVGAAISRDGAVLSLATAERELLVFSLTEELVETASMAAQAAEVAATEVAVSGFGSGAEESARWHRASTLLRHRVEIRGALACAFRCESAVSALSVLHVPCHPDAFSFSRFRLSGYVIASGHTNGFLNLWWCGDIGGAEGSGKASAAAVSATPTASYPPTHASRGAILHMSPAFVAPTGVERASVPPMFSSMRAGARVSASARGGRAGSGLSTVVCIGAHGARGWRVFEIPHLPIPARPSPPVQPAPVQSRSAAAAPASSAAAGGTSLAASLSGIDRARPDRTGGVWEWDRLSGRRVFVPPPPANVSYLRSPCFEVPSLEDSMRFAVIGDPAWRSSTDLLAPTTSSAAAASSAQLSGLPALSQGVDPRGCALLQRLPSADSDFIAGAVLEGATADDSLSAVSLFSGLAPSAIAADRGLFRLLSRSPGGRFANHAELFPPNDAASAAAAEQLRRNRGAGKASAAAPSAPGGARGDFLHLPRTVMLLLTETGLHCAGFDHSPGLALSNVRAEEAARESATAIAARQRGLNAAKQSRLQAEQLLCRQQELEAARVAERERALAESVANARVVHAGPAPDIRQASKSFALLPPPPPPPPNAPTMPRPARAELSRRSSPSQAARPRAPPVYASRDIWAPLVEPPRPSYPMSVTGRHDSLIRGQRAVFDAAPEAAGGVDARLRYLPKHAAARLAARKASAGL